MCVLSHSFVSDSLRPCGASTRLLCPWGFSRQEYWGRLPFPTPGDHFPTQGSNLSLLNWQVDSLQEEALDKIFITMAVVTCWFWHISGSWAGKISLLLSFLEVQSVPFLMPVAPCPSPAPASHPVSLSLCWTAFMSSLPPSTVQRLSLRAGRGGSTKTEDFVESKARPIPIFIPSNHSL